MNPKLSNYLENTQIVIQGNCYPEVDIKLVNDTLKQAREYGLETEVMWSAFRYYADNKNLEWCFSTALMDWDI